MVADVAYLEQSLQHSQQQLSQLESSFARQRQAFKANPMPSAEQRIQWLKVLTQLLTDSQEALIQAISQDFSNRSADETLLAELMPSLHGIHYASKRIKKWMKPSRRSVGLQFMPAAGLAWRQRLGNDEALFQSALQRFLTEWAALAAEGGSLRLKPEKIARTVTILQASGQLKGFDQSASLFTNDFVQKAMAKYPKG